MYIGPDPLCSQLFRQLIAMRTTHDVKVHNIIGSKLTRTGKIQTGKPLRIGPCDIPPLLIPTFQIREFRAENSCLYFDLAP